MINGNRDRQANAGELWQSASLIREWHAQAQLERGRADHETRRCNHGQTSLAAPPASGAPLGPCVRREESTRGPRALTGLLLAVVSLSFSCSSFAQAGAFLAGRPLGRIESDALRELSGIAASRRNPGVLYVHNDSGDAPRIYAINEKAQLLGACNIQGVRARDWEDIAVGPGPEPNRPCVYIGDIGDNEAKRPEVVVYRVPEPKLDPAVPFGQVRVGPADGLRFTYPDGPRDAETLLVDPLTRDIYIISKRDLSPRVYHAAYPQSTTQPTRLKQVALLPFGTFPTGGDVAPDGRRVLVRSMFHAGLWERPAGEPLWRAFSGPQAALPLADEPQGEAICCDSQGRGYFTISEGTHATLYYFAPAPPPLHPTPGSAE
jgi:hypothetical protein